MMALLTWSLGTRIIIVAPVGAAFLILTSLRLAPAFLMHLLVMFLSLIALDQVLMLVLAFIIDLRVPWFLGRMHFFIIIVVHDITLRLLVEFGDK
jgi:hypothetical protein